MDQPMNQGRHGDCRWDDGMIKGFATSRKGDAEGKVEMRVNEEIDVSTVRLVHADGNHEVIPIRMALQKAREAKLDLLEVSPGSDPPVVRLADFSEMQKKNRVKERERTKKIREHQKTDRGSEIRLTPRISPHDLQMKIKKITELLEKRHKVMVIVMAPSVADKKMGHEALQYVRSILAGKAKVCSESNLNRQGTVSMTLLPLVETTKTAEGSTETTIET